MDKQDSSLYKAAKKLIASGIYDQDQLFKLLYPTSRKHYATVRHAIHLAKSGIVN